MKNNLATVEHITQNCTASDALWVLSHQDTFNANRYSTRQLLEIELQWLPNSIDKNSLIAEAVQLVEQCSYTIAEAANEIRISMVGLLELASLKPNFLTFVGEWVNEKECRTGENRVDGTVTYLMDGLYLYEFKTRQDAFKYLYEDDRLVPYAFAQYDAQVSKENAEETFGDWECFNGFHAKWLETK